MITYFHTFNCENSLEGRQIHKRVESLNMKFNIAINFTFYFIKVQIRVNSLISWIFFQPLFSFASVTSCLLSAVVAWLTFTFSLFFLYIVTVVGIIFVNAKTFQPFALLAAGTNFHLWKPIPFCFLPPSSQLATFTCEC